MYQVPDLEPKKRTTGIGNPEVRRQIGQELRSAREFQQMTIEQLSAKTKINLRHLETLESGEWSFLPPTYIKAFLKAYIEAVRLDSKEIHSKLDELFADLTSFDPAYRQQQIGMDQENQSVKPSGFIVWAEQNRSLLYYGALGLIFIVIIVYFLIPKNDSEPISPYTSAPEIIEHKPVSQFVPDSTQSIAKDTEAKPIVPEIQTYNLSLIATDTCYVKVADEDTIYYERTLWPRNRLSKDLTNPVKLSLGNSEGVIVIVQGDTLPPFPLGRKVRVVNIDKTGIIG